MATGKPVNIPWPLSSFPGANSQESAGRLINVYAEPLDKDGPLKIVWRRSPGLSQLALTGFTGYRGGLNVSGTSYEIWSGQAATVDALGTIAPKGPLPGTRGVSIARNNASPPNVIAVDLDNGAYRLDPAGPPTSYNAGGILPQPKAVCFQDGYLFFLIADRRVFATDLNALTMNALTFVRVDAKSSDIGMRVIPFSGLLFIFCTSATEVYQDTANPAPGFPYSRLQVLEYGLVQENAIAGFEDGFSVLMWAAQDNSIYQLLPGSLAPGKVSPPDLDRLIERAVKDGDSLDAGCYIAGGKKFWVLSSSNWSWEFNVSTQKWNERESLQGVAPGRWRAVRGHPAFDKWLMGDTLSGALLYPDTSNFTENSAPLKARMVSAPVVDFPNRVRIARADFDFITGTGRVANDITMMVLGTSSGTGGVVQLFVNHTANVSTGDFVVVSNVNGTVEANGSWTVAVIDAQHLELIGSTFAHAWISGGTAVDVTAHGSTQNPVVALSVSSDGGQTFCNPWIRKLGIQANTTQRLPVTNAGLSSTQGDRWQWEISDPVYAAFLGATQSSDVRKL